MRISSLEHLPKLRKEDFFLLPLCRSVSTNWPVRGRAIYTVVKWPSFAKGIFTAFPSTTYTHKDSLKPFHFLSLYTYNFRRKFRIFTPFQGVPFYVSAVDPLSFQLTQCSNMLIKISLKGTFSIWTAKLNMSRREGFSSKNHTSFSEASCIFMTQSFGPVASLGTVPTKGE